MKVHMLSLGPLGANCYILETDQKNAIAVDIGGDPESVHAHGHAGL